MKKWFEEIPQRLYDTYMKNGDTVGLDGIYKQLVNTIIDKLREFYEEYKVFEFMEKISELINRYKDYERDEDINWEINRIELIDCARCGEKIDCRRFICEKCFQELKKKGGD